jgi:hypothetical protein
MLRIGTRVLLAVLAALALTAQPSSAVATRTLTASWNAGGQFDDHLSATVWWDGTSAGKYRMWTNCNTLPGWSCENAQVGAGWYEPKKAFMIWSNRKLDWVFRSSSYTYLRLYIQPSGVYWTEATCRCS